MFFSIGLNQDRSCSSLHINLLQTDSFLCGSSKLFHDLSKAHQWLGRAGDFVAGNGIIVEYIGTIFRVVEGLKHESIAIKVCSEWTCGLLKLHRQIIDELMWINRIISKVTAKESDNNSPTYLPIQRCMDCSPDDSSREQHNCCGIYFLMLKRLWLNCDFLKRLPA